MSKLFESLQLGELRLANRIVMAPMTRNRAEADGTPNALMVEHYG
ncbi:MAG: alkene reductase, partial [Polaromonas sp.]